MNNRPTALNRRTLIAALAGVALPLAFGCSPAVARRVPAPVPATYTAPGAPQVAVLAGGCFWGIQGVYSHVKGVTQAVSGFAGGTVANPSYELVSTGRTGHAESVRITFDPAQISYGDILQIFFSVATDPTQLNRQGPDTGTQYRNEIFYTTPDQKRIAEAYIAQLGQLKVYSSPIVTKVSSLKAFYPAEGYHQDYLLLHPEEPYIAINDIPKVNDLKFSFPNFWRDAPLRTALR